MRIVLLTVFYLLFRTLTNAQVKCTELGQNPETAFPVCGEKVFTQHEVKICGDRKVPGPCDYDDVSDKNPYWYKFTCFSAGTLGFVITPMELSDDYDWQLFDITGHDPKDVYANKDLFVACNWSGEPGVTGASDQGRSISVCGGFGKDLWSRMPQLKVGHQYLLLISHFTDTQSGYSLEFKGGTASITDTKIPAVEYALGSCKGNQVGIKLNKKLRCSSLSSDGSEFRLPNGEAVVTGARAYSCNESFEMDSVVVYLDRPLPPGNYSIAIQPGTDGNTLYDICETELAPVTTTFTIHQDVSAQFDYNMLTGCKNDTILVAHNGANNVFKWHWNFAGERSASTQQGSHVFTIHGTKDIQLIVSNGHCMDTSDVSVTVEQKLKADFEAPEIICVKNKAQFIDKSEGKIDNWLWDYGQGAITYGQHPTPFQYTSAGGREKTYTVKLIVSDQQCSDTIMRNVLVVNNCIIAVPSAFTPNNDGKNDYLYPSNAFDAENLLFRVYNRYGQLLFESKDWTKKWDGTFKGQPQPPGTYVWTLSYILRTTGGSYILKGATVLIR